MREDYLDMVAAQSCYSILQNPSLAIRLGWFSKLRCLVVSLSEECKARHCITLHPASYLPCWSLCTFSSETRKPRRNRELLNPRTLNSLLQQRVRMPRCNAESGVWGGGRLECSGLGFQSLRFRTSGVLGLPAPDDRMLETSQERPSPEARKV